MPILPGNQSPSFTAQQVVNQLKAKPEFFNALTPAVGYSQEPGLTIANEILSRILAENMPWKWNRSMIAPFITFSLQQDYLTKANDIGWLEHAVAIDINNSTSNNYQAAKPVYPMETVRDLFQSSFQGGKLFNISYVPNSQAYMGKWVANTAYSCPYGVAQMPTGPVQQFVDVNGNILYIDSTVLNLDTYSPGYAGTTIPPPSNSPYGISGSTQPAAVPNATSGTTVADGSVIWTVADPNCYALRLDPIPNVNGLCYLVKCWYQVRPPYISNLQTLLTPLPYEMMYLFRQGFAAKLYEHIGDARARASYDEWEETLMKAVRAADRQQEDFCIYPGQSIMSGGDPWSTQLNLGPAWPFGGGQGF